LLNSSFTIRKNTSGVKEGNGDSMTEVVVHQDESFESALRRFKRKCQHDGVLMEMRKREFYETPSVRRKKKEAAAARKLKRRLMREDL